MTAYRGDSVVGNRQSPSPKRMGFSARAWVSMVTRCHLSPLWVPGILVDGGGPLAQSVLGAVWTGLLALDLRYSRSPGRWTSPVRRAPVRVSVLRPSEARAVTSPVVTLSPSFAAFVQCMYALICLSVARGRLA